MPDLFHAGSSKYEQVSNRLVDWNLVRVQYFILSHLKPRLLRQSAVARRDRLKASAAAFALRHAGPFEERNQYQRLIPPPETGPLGGVGGGTFQRCRNLWTGCARLPCTVVGPFSRQHHKRSTSRRASGQLVTCCAAFPDHCDYSNDTVIIIIPHAPLCRGTAPFSVLSLALGFQHICFRAFNQRWLK